jgi:hypothetical protein
VSDNRLSKLENYGRLGRLHQLIFSPNNNYTPEEIAERSRLFARAYSRLDISGLSEAVQTSPSIVNQGVEDILTPTGGQTPTASSSLTPTQSTINLNILEDKPIQSIPNLILPGSAHLEFVQKKLDYILYNKNLTLDERFNKLSFLKNIVADPKYNINPTVQEIVDRSDMFDSANKRLDSMKPVSGNIGINITDASKDLITLDHSPIKESIPDNIDWAKGGKLKGIFSKQPKIVYPELELTVNP